MSVLFSSISTSFLSIYLLFTNFLSAFQWKTGFLNRAAFVLNPPNSQADEPVFREIAD